MVRIVQVVRYVPVHVHVPAHPHLCAPVLLQQAQQLVAVPGVHVVVAEPRQQGRVREEHGGAVGSARVGKLAVQPLDLVVAHTAVVVLPVLLPRRLQLRRERQRGPVLLRAGLVAEGGDVRRVHDDQAVACVLGRLARDHVVAVPHVEAGHDLLDGACPDEVVVAQHVVQRRRLVERLQDCVAVAALVLRQVAEVHNEAEPLFVLLQVRCHLLHLRDGHLVVPHARRLHRPVLHVCEDGEGEEWRPQVAAQHPERLLTRGWDAVARRTGRGQQDHGCHSKGPSHLHPPPPSSHSPPFFLLLKQRIPLFKENGNEERERRRPPSFLPSEGGYTQSYTINEVQIL
eukprot:Rhum_TRINITY_DN16562_c0_g1::Rhum_TRINITY_DN16562_c0_g1_i1::g.163645::m.163645